MPQGRSTSYARLTPFLRGVIYGMFLSGMTIPEIRDEIIKGDGECPSYNAVGNLIKQCTAKGGLLWNGGADVKHAGGRPRTTTSSLDRKVIKLVFKHRGSAKVTVKFVRKVLVQARSVSARTLERRLRDAGLKWLQRRRKTLVPALHKELRVSFARWVLRRTVATLALMELCSILPALPHRRTIKDAWLWVVWCGRWLMVPTRSSRSALGHQAMPRARARPSAFGDCSLQASCSSTCCPRTRS